MKPAAAMLAGPGVAWACKDARKALSLEGMTHSSTNLGAVLLAALLITPASASPKVSAVRIKRDVATLSSNKFDGRGPGEKGETRTIVFIAKSMAAAGLAPAGDRGTWFQDVPLVRLDRRPGARMVLGGGSGAPQTLALGSDATLTLRNAGGFTLANAPLVFGGWGIVDPAKGYDAYAGADIRGKVVLLLANDPDFEADRNLGFGGRALDYAGRGGVKTAAALKAGAAGVIFVHEEAAYSWPFLQAANGDLLPSFASQPQSPSMLGFTAIVRSDIGAAMLAKVGLSLAQAKTLARAPGFRARPIPSVLVSVSGSNRATPFVSHNVIGRLRGTTRADESVLYGAHWDANGHNGPDPSGDAIRNGAVDNATGTAELIEIARAFASGRRPARSIVFAAWTSEEKGLIGSDYYANHPLFPLATTAAVINLDPHVVLPASRDLELIGGGQVSLEDDLGRIARSDGQRLVPEPNPEAGWYFRSDHFPFSQRGVPAIAFRAGRDLIVGGRIAGQRIVGSYNRNCYHQPCDQFDPNWSFAGTTQEATAAWQLGLGVANSASWPEWRPGSAYGFIRAASAAQRL
jgi:Zn-dependent M28 family amino/carboxypeptidase